MRQEGENYSTRGPVAAPMDEEAAIAMARQLATQFPNQQFVVVQVIAAIDIRASAAIKYAPAPGRGQVISLSGVGGQ